MRKRFHSATVDKTLASFQRHGIMTVLIPSILPPPAPFKIFVLMAGVARIGVAEFSTAVAIGRGARYFTEGLLALWYGDRAIAFMHGHAATVSLIVVGALGAALAAYVVWTKARSAKSR